MARSRSASWDRRKRADSRDGGKRRRDDSYDDERGRYGGSRGYSPRDSRRGNSPRDTRRRTRSPAERSSGYSAVPIPSSSRGGSSVQAVVAAPPPQAAAPPSVAAAPVPVATSRPPPEVTNLAPPKATNEFDWESPEAVYDALCRVDNELLPPGWEKVTFKGTTIYLDHLRREAFEEKPWIVWERRAQQDRGIHGSAAR
eukprot:CAMPEP_0176418628 /NCGR_PEP_ID=MMETSP0127-20121128/7577_1 /TAXON_ID=938130 /ORGANISM="Platyophrya macrostoma, Strain WH" /LENGTH=198 /DNA_ID=CAMNT_0017798975 /DNA_START=72 /DNA_END=668 /DNA_ORIENTATION=+